jgi:hypothetical protein
VNFYANIDVKQSEAEVQYDYEALGDDVYLIKNDHEKYCLK